MKEDINISLKADLIRYGSDASLFNEQSLWAIRVFRWGQSIDRYPDGLKKLISTKLYWLLFRFVETLTGISLPKETNIGPGLRIWHFGNIFIHPNAVIGSDCTLRQGVTIGNRAENGPVPIIGNNVEIGAYAQILGGVRIGNNCKIGAMSVVLQDLPDNCTAVGNPARIISK